MKKGVSKYDGKFNVGDSFGNWIVVNSGLVFSNDMNEYSIKVKCKCDKQTERYVSCRKLKSGISWGCDCVRRKNNSHFWKGIGEIPGRYINRIKTNAAMNGIQVSISKEYLWKLFKKQNKKCALSGLEIGFGGRNEETTASLDRIDSSKGYVNGNVWWVHKDINIMKNNFCVDKFRELCRMVISYDN